MSIQTEYLMNPELCSLLNNDNIINNDNVLESLCSERQYQENIWNKDTTESGGLHPTSDFLVFMQEYLSTAIKTVSRNGEPEASMLAAHDLRKITAMALASSEKNGWSDFLIKYNYSVSCDFDRSLVTVLGHIQYLLNSSFEASYRNQQDVIKFNVSQIFWEGVYAMSLKPEYSPLRDIK